MVKTKERVVVAVIVYNRFDNLKRWVEAWKKCDKDGAELVVIHNYENDSAREQYKSYCEEQGIKYVPRVNRGFDIGAFQDVCRARLQGFDNDWDILLWITDDTIPMRKDFVQLFVERLNHRKVGVSCMQLSKEYAMHIRTTGFCLRKETARKLVFPADPIVTKIHCYQFEHRAKEHTFYQQIVRMGLIPAQVGDLASSPLWDTGHSRFKRMHEFNTVFASTEPEVKPINTQGEKVIFIAPIHNSFPELISSLICQTHKNWELILIHDGPNTSGLSKFIAGIGDRRIKYRETASRGGNWGHKIRRDTLIDLKRSDCSYIVITNPDNYYVPTFTEKMIKGFKDNPIAVATYCSHMVHNYRDWETQECRFERGYLDCGGVMVKADIATSVGFNNITDHSADWFYFEDIAKTYGAHRFQPVKGTLFVHN